MPKDSIQDVVLRSHTANLSAIIIANPNSGAGGLYNHTVHMDETLKILRGQGWRVKLHVTHAAGDAQRLARQAVEQKVNLVIVAGGDGTINEVIQALAGSETALGVIPSGTVNVWAREMGIPLNETGAREVLLHGQVRAVDLGRVNERYFLLMVGVGLDGDVTHEVERKPLKRLGALGYLLVATLRGIGYPGFPVTLNIDGHIEKTHALQIIIGNTQLYGGAMKFTWQAKCDDGKLDICLVSNRNVIRRIVTVWDFFLHRKQRHLRVRYYTCSNVEVQTQKPIAMQIDGDPADYTPAQFTIVPRALKVVVPQHLPEELFSPAEAEQGT
jgi:diacylglycerol kinase (ATP)